MPRGIMQDITTLPKIKGFHWLCSYCESHAILGPKTTNKKPAVAPSTSRVQHNNTQTSIEVQHQVPNAETTQSTLTTSNDQIHREEPTHHTLPHKPMQTVTKNQHVFTTTTTGANTVFQVRTMIIDIQKHAKNV